MSLAYPFRWKKLGFWTVAIFVVWVGIARYRNSPKCISGTCKEGLSKLQYANGDIYEGLVKDSKPNGKGVFWNDRGDYYEGEWMNGMRHGKGSYRYPNGTAYEGDFVFNKRNGIGAFRWDDGTTLRGEWKEDIPEGDCTMILPDNRKLVGRYLQGRIFDGEGVLIYDDGSRYIGAWKNGMRHGKGVLLDPFGSVLFQGIWFENREKTRIFDKDQATADSAPKKNEKHSKNRKRK